MPIIPVGTFAFKHASKNWKDWEDVFEHEGKPTTNPLLVDERRFRKFLKDYVVHRTIRSKTSDELREHLLADEAELNDVLYDTTGKALDTLNGLLRNRFGTSIRTNPNADPRSIISALSKIAAFLAPSNFTAWDQYARRGLARRAKVRGFTSYADYIAAMNDELRGPLGDEVRKVIAKHGGKMTIAFQRRVLDVHLMLEGGRNFKTRRGRAH